MTERDHPDTRTVSVCVSIPEADYVSAAAANAGVSKSAWLAGAVVHSLSKGKTRAAVLDAARKIEADGSPRGSRSARVSTVIKLHDHEELKTAAKSLGIAVHAYVQAVAIAGSREAVGDRSTAAVRAVRHAKGASSLGSTTTLRVPAAFEGVDVVALGEFLHRLVTATAVHILDGTGRKIADGASRLAARVKAEPTALLRVAVPEFEVMAAAHVLGIPADDYATALATRACRAMEAL